VKGPVGLQVFATDLNDTAVQDMMKSYCWQILQEMTEKILINLKLFKAAEKTCNY
jgi:hypothetical protein